MVKIYNYNLIRNFTTKKKNEPIEQLYGYALRDKFTAICHAELIRKVLNKTENDIMLLRSDFINISHVNNIYSVYNGYSKISLHVKPNMVGYRVGEFIHCRKVKNLKKNDTSNRRGYRRIQKSSAIFGKDKQKLLKNDFDLTKVTDTGSDTDI